jgi:uncharacterized membrane-anchored protein
MSRSLLITQHPQRGALHNEIHARPPEPLARPVAISHVVMACDGAQREQSRDHLATLLNDHHLPLPGAQSIHLRMDLATFRIRWEQHTEFVSWTFMRTIEGGSFEDREPPTSIEVVPHEWLAALPGTCLVAMHLWVLEREAVRIPPWVRRMMNEDPFVASAVAGEDGLVCTDFVVHADGFSRMVVFAGDLTPRRTGRLVQRLLEIETYRMAALLGLPAARQAASVLASAERELAELAQAIRSARHDQEPQLLDSLTRLAGQVEGEYAATHSRFSASAAYFDLVDKRIRDIGETRIPGLQTIAEFMDRRLTPARSTCEWAARRQDALSQRVSRISNLLRTRVEIEQQLSSQALLKTMNERQDLQLKLQSTVEGLSVAAITYYIVGLIGYLAKGAQKLGWPFSPETSTAAAIPIVAVAVWWSIRRAHQVIVGKTRA